MVYKGPHDFSLILILQYVAVGSLVPVRADVYKSIHMYNIHMYNIHMYKD